MNDIRNNITEQINEGVEHHSFEITDRLGRDVGAQISLCTRIVEAPVAGQEASWLNTTRQETGTWFCWLGYATRAGKIYGAIQHWHYCATEAQRHAEVAKYLKAAAKRAGKHLQAA